MILGRHPNLWLAFVDAVWNVIFILHVFNITTEAYGAVNLALAAFIALIANNGAISIDAGRTALRNAQSTGSATSAPR